MRQSSPEPARPSDLDACRELLRHGSKSFFAASLLLPRSVRDPATALYAFCRIADDAVDLSDDPAAALAQLHLRLERIYRGQPFDHPVDRATAAASCTRHERSAGKPSLSVPSMVIVSALAIFFVQQQPR